MWYYNGKLENGLELVSSQQLSHSLFSRNSLMDNDNIYIIRLFKSEILVILYGLLNI